MFKKAIVRTPSRSMVKGITSANLGIPDYAKAKAQHQAYIHALEKCELEVTVLEPLEEFPDSVFIEDTALLTPECAIITNPGATTRRGEARVMRAVLSAFYKNIEIVKDPGTVDAGDILNVNTHYYIGISERTNQNGAYQMIGYLEKYGMTASTIQIRNVLHLKSALSYLKNNILLVSEELLNESQFQKYNIIIVKEEESYAANCLWINGFVLVPVSFPKITKKIKDIGYQVIELDVSEFRKLDGGLSCLSLRF